MKTALILLGIAAAGSIPVWRCGVRENLTFWEFVLAHMVFDSQPVMYIPEEVYSRSLTQGEFDKLCAVYEAEQIAGYNAGSEAVWQTTG